VSHLRQFRLHRPPARQRRLPAAVAVLVAGCLAVGGCSRGSSGAGPVPPRTPPDIAAFLRLPVATPSACPSNVNGTTVGRRSPWSGHVDVSVFVAPSAPGREVAALGVRLRRDPLVSRVYFESQREAYREFQRLYTCWTAVPSSQAPASYRLILTPAATFGQRNALVEQLARLPAVDTVSCDPTVPCVSAVRSATAS
jgi:FtsX extracellular domain